jgi:serine/threonine protein kinase
MTYEQVVIKAPRGRDHQVATEIKIHSVIGKHRYIVSKKDVIDTNTGRAMVIPFAPGGDLYSQLEFRTPRCFTEEETKMIIWKMLTALAHIHNLGIYHRDVKLDNILIMSTEVTDVALNDFGLAICKQLGIGHEGTWGTLFYQAPELLGTWDSNYDGRVDVWSLGVVFYCLIAGSFPFDVRDDEPLGVIQQEVPNLSENFRLTHLSESGKSLLMRMLTIDKRVRITAADALCHAWFWEEDDQYRLYDFVQVNVIRRSPSLLLSDCEEQNGRLVETERRNVPPAATLAFPNTRLIAV